MTDRPRSIEDMIEKRIVFGPEDVLSIRFYCQGCNNEVLWRFPVQGRNPPIKCPFCEDGTRRWMDSDQWMAVLNLGAALKTIREQNGQDEKFRVGFEIGPAGDSR